jgi:hypothetical protein
MGKKEDDIRRRAEAAFAEQLAANSAARKAAADAADSHQSVLAKIAEQRARRLAKKPKDKPPMNGRTTRVRPLQASAHPREAPMFVDASLLFSPFSPRSLARAADIGRLDYHRGLPGPTPSRSEAPITQLSRFVQQLAQAIDKQGQSQNNDRPHSSTLRWAHRRKQIRRGAIG